MKVTLVILIVCLVAFGKAFSPSCASDATFGSNPLCVDWIFNTKNISSVFNTVTDVQQASIYSSNGKSYAKVECTGIPEYSTYITQDIVDQLNGRPKASRDFKNGKTTARVGDVIQFGQDIGFNNPHCSLGYWPPGPMCPTASSDKTGYFPLKPTKSQQTCYTGLGEIGFWKNGISVFNWWDGTSYLNEGQWHVLANDGEFYDMGLCIGHAAQGDYHHHGYPACLGKKLNDFGTKVSPIYGFAADGFPILGPYVTGGVLAQSCWKKRNYDDPTDPTSCGVAKKRTCVLNDQYDISKGVKTVQHAGPDTDTKVITQSRNYFYASSGYFFEDYYYDAECTKQGEQFLDEYNGRVHEEYGYAYHITIGINGDGSIENIFPHYVGPKYYGTIDNLSLAKRCSTSMFQGPGGPGGPGGHGGHGCCPDGSQPSSSFPPCTQGPPSPSYCSSSTTSQQQQQQQQQPQQQQQQGPPRGGRNHGCCPDGSQPDTTTFPPCQQGPPSPSHCSNSQGGNSQQQQLQQRPQRGGRNHGCCPDGSQPDTTTFPPCQQGPPSPSHCKI